MYDEIFRCRRHSGIPLTKGVSEIPIAKLAPVLAWSRIRVPPKMGDFSTGKLNQDVVEVNGSV